SMVRCWRGQRDGSLLTTPAAADGKWNRAITGTPSHGAGCGPPQDPGRPGTPEQQVTAGDTRDARPASSHTHVTTCPLQDGLVKSVNGPSRGRARRYRQAGAFLS